VQEYALNNGLRIPSIGFGTYKIPPAQAFSAVTEALRVGYRHIDTAMIYVNEEEVGRAIRESGIPRKEIFVTTKLWNADHADARAAFETSLKKLGLDYIDLYLQHWPNPERVASWKVMEELVDEGLVRSIGVSNFLVRHLESFLPHVSIAPAVNQFEFSSFLFQTELLDYCAERKILVEAYSPLTRGKRLEDEKIAAIAKAHGKTSAQVLLRWCLQHGTLPLPRSVTPSHIRENFEVFDFVLSDGEMAMLDGMHEGFRVAPDPTNLP